VSALKTAFKTLKNRFRAGAGECAGCGGASFLCDRDAWSEVARGDGSDAAWPEARWVRPWASPPAALDELHRAVARLKPAVLVETGTLEAHGTCALALAAPEGARLLTFDYDGDPTTDDVSEADWAQLRAIREAALQTIRAVRPDLDLRFIDGDTRGTLAAEGEALDGWAFWFQDSMHDEAGVAAEWALAGPRAGPGAVVVFDNMDHRRPWGRRFTQEIAPEAGWCWRAAAVGPQRRLWARRIG